MTLKAAYLSALVLLSASAGAMAGPIADAGQQAEVLAAEGKTLEALQALDDAVNTIWVESPLLFRDVTLVEAEGENGSAERTNRQFQPDATLRVRVEPVGYGYGGSGDRVKIGFAGDLSMENATGQILAEAKDLFSVAVDSAPGNRHFDMTISFVVPYVRPGDYTARFTVRDQNSQKSGTFDVPFTVAAPTAATEAPAADAAMSGTPPAAPVLPAAQPSAEAGNSAAASDSTAPAQ
jgi:hypothetical protein